MISRRGVISRRAALSVPAFALLAGCADFVEKADRPGTAADDAATLNAILGLEYQALHAYTIALPLLGAARQPLATHFRADHEKHAEAIGVAVTRLGAVPVTALPAVGLTGQLRDEGDALRLAASIERGIAAAYLGAVPALGDRDLSRSAAAILAVETSHWAIWREALGEPPIAPFLTG